jgi:hypothetical protein
MTQGDSVSFDSAELQGMLRLESILQNLINPSLLAQRIFHTDRTQSTPLLIVIPS